MEKILDKILLLPSPLKGGVKRALFGDNRDKKEGKKKMDAALGKLDSMTKDLQAIDTSNPFKDAQNAFKDMDNVYDKAKNVYEGKMENKFEGQKNAYEGMKNQFENMENAFEDLTVNTQQAEFEAQQNAQNQANILSQMSASAGGSGIAALAQSMANQGALQAQKASASIGAQEAENQKKAAEAEQNIQMATAGEGSKIAMAQAGEQSRLDTQKRQADMDIQNKILDADNALQAQKLGEESKLQMAEAQGEMQVQELKGKGDMWSKEQELSKQKTAMEMQMSKVQMYSSSANQPKDRGIIGNLLSDKRAKENITKIGTTHSHIPVYKFNYIGDNTTYVGTMAQDLIKMGREDAVGTKGDYYTVNYNLIDVKMRKLSSPLKQMANQQNQQGQQSQQPNPQQQEAMDKNKGMMDSGMDILSEAQRRRNWEETQEAILATEPEETQARKIKDQKLRDEQKAKLGRNPIIEGGFEGVGNYSRYMEAMTGMLKEYQELIYRAITDGDAVTQQSINMKVAGLKRVTDRFKEECQDFYDDYFSPETYISKSCSQQQKSFATQLYCMNPDLVIVHASKEDVARGQVDVYGELVAEDMLYGIVQKFDGTYALISVLDGNKNTWWVDGQKAIEYIGFLKETADTGKEAAASKSAVKLDFGSIDYKVSKFFGDNDGTASKHQDMLVLQFCWDTDLLRDGSSFRRHLYEHPQIENLNYGGFDFDKMDFKPELGPGDKNYWHDNLDELDKLRLVDAICNVDNPAFDIKLLRTLVKEYYTIRIENAWWKSMGYEEGRLELMRIKQNELKKARFEKAKAKAQEDGLMEFVFDGKVEKSGLTEAKKKQMEKEKEKAVGGKPQPKKQ